MTKERKNRMHFIKRIASLAASIVMILSMSVSRQPQIMAVTEPLDIHLTIETKEIDIADIPDDRRVSLEMYVENCPPFTGMWAYFEKDPRLEFDLVKPFSIVDGVQNISPLNTLSHVEIEPHMFGCGIPAIIGRHIDHSGAIVTVNVFLPENVKSGDFYQINFSKYIGETPMMVDFGRTIDERYYETSFTQLNGGGILITGSAPQPEPPVQQQPVPEPPAPEEPPAEVPGDNGNGNTDVPDEPEESDVPEENSEAVTTTVAETTKAAATASTTTASTSIVTTASTTETTTSASTSSKTVTETSITTSSATKEREGNEDTENRKNNWIPIIAITLSVTVISSAALLLTKSRRK